MIFFTFGARGAGLIGQRHDFSCFGDEVLRVAGDSPQGRSSCQSELALGLTGVAERRSPIKMDQ